MKLDAWLTMRARKAGSAPKQFLSNLYPSKGRRTKYKQDYPWLLRSVRSAQELSKHRAAIERDCFASPSHRAVMQEAAREYDRAMAQPVKPGRPTTRNGRRGISIPKSTRRAA